MAAEVADECSPQRWPGKREDDENNEERSKDQQQDLAELEPPDSGLLQFLEKRERTELDCSQFPQIQKMQEDRKSRREETKQSQGIEECHCAAAPREIASMIVNCVAPKTP